MSSYLPRALTAQDLVETALRRRGVADAVVDPRRRLRVEDLADRTARVANALPHLGANESAPVAVLVGNRSEYVEIDLGAVRAGIPRLGLGERLSPDEWFYMLADSGAPVLIVAAAFLERIDELPDTV